PFFIGEMLALLRDASGAAGGAGDYAQHLSSMLEGKLTLPGTIKQTLTRRLDYLSMSCRTVLRAAAAIGPRFSVSTLARVSTLDLRATEDALDEAVAATLVYEDELWPGQYQLAHALLQLALYSELLPGQRRRLHFKAAEV